MYTSFWEKKQQQQKKLAAAELFVCFCTDRGFEREYTLESLYSVLFCLIMKRFVESFVFFFFIYIYFFHRLQEIIEPRKCFTFPINDLPHRPS